MVAITTGRRAVTAMKSTPPSPSRKKDITSFWGRGAAGLGDALPTHPIGSGRAPTLVPSVSTVVAPFLARPLLPARFCFGFSLRLNDGLLGVRPRPPKVFPKGLIAPPLGDLLVNPRPQIGDSPRNFDAEAQGENGGALRLFQLCCGILFMAMFCKDGDCRRIYLLLVQENFLLCSSFPGGFACCCCCSPAVAAFSADAGGVTMRGGASV